MEPILPLEELMWKTFPEQTWLVDQLIPSAALTILSGPPASYKTWVLLQIAISVASGKSLFGQYETTQTGVLIIDEENGERLLQQRMFQLQASANLPIYFSSYQGFILNDENVDLTLLSCKAYGIKLLILDSLVRIHASDENSAGDMSDVFKQLKRFAANDITVVVTHHNRKPGIAKGGISSEMRGSSDILASVDCHIGLSRRDKSLTFHQTKQRYAQELEPFEVLVDANESTFSLNFLGEIKQHEDKDKLISVAILALLKDTGKLYQKQMLSLLADSGCKTNEHKLREILSRMVSDKEIAESQGAGNTKFYNLPDEVPYE